ncbi:MAG: ABC transporter ATP-binding protein [Pirellulales bacterium]|nr:ABC transporter ATP-binding protein [Pirellulales bacterium]
MNNFGRVVRLSLRYRWTFVASIVCAVLAAALWGGNIGTVYPVLKVAFENESLQNWAEKEIAGSREKIRECEDEIAQLEARLKTVGPEETAALEVRLRAAQTRIGAERKAVATIQWLKPLVDRLPRDPFATLALFIGILLVGTLVKEAFLIANTILVARLAHLGTFQLRKLFYRRTLKMDLASFHNEGTSDLMSRFTYDMEAVAGGLVVLFGKVVREPLKAIACLVGAAFICWRLLLLSLIVAPVAGLMIHWLGRTLKRANRRAMEEMALLYNRLEETFRGIKVVKAFATERQERWRFHLNSKKYFKKSMRIARYDSLSHPITEIMGILTICLALLAGAYLVLEKETHLLGIRISARPLDLPTLLVFYGLLAGTADPLRKLSEIFTKLQGAAAASDRIYSRLDRVSQVRNPEHPKPLPRHGQDLVFDNVDFAYRPGELVLEGINLRIRAGETIALVGPNGCGKSTLVNLIPRFADPTTGEVRLDGLPLPEARLRDLRRQIGLVAQETMLFDDTVLENIRYGSPQATREQVIEASRQAHAHRFIENDLPDGYQTIVGSAGSRLSGGQRQRIALARAILRDPAILLLDEATSQVDLESEQLIQQVLEKFIRHRTTVIITHRLAVLALADRIVAMEGGKILDVGAHAELLARCDLYRRLYQIQFADLRESA